MQGEGVAVTNSSEAKVGFQPIDPPASIGQIVEIFQSDPVAVPEADRHLLWVISGNVGLFHLDESASDLTQKQLEELVECQPEETGCDTTGWTLTEIGTSASALLIDGTQTRGGGPTSMTWLQDNVLLVVIGPAETFSAVEATRVAREIATSVAR